MTTDVLNGSLYIEMVRNGAANLQRNREIVNELNVFPVPDGDTGDNMYLTIDSGTSAVMKTPSESLSEASDCIAKGMLLGARGNSGVILSRIFSGIAKNLMGNDTADVRILGQAFTESIKEAYSAVSKPVEGTILSVYRDAVQKANEQISECSTINSFFDDFLEETRASLERTPELLEVLKEAGVVDSGGAGFVYIAEGMKKALDGEKIEAEGGRPEGAGQEVDLDSFNEDSELTYGYCTEFLLRLQNKKCDIANFDIDALTEYLNAVGNSVVSFKEGSIVKVHVHTMCPGDVLNHCQQYGEFLKLKIENMNLQHNEQDENTPAGKAEKHVVKHKKFGVVTVANGEGIIKMFKELGADAVVEGGQCMNPSAIDFVNAFDTLNCDEIIVFPNNSNIVLTAQQAAELYEKKKVSVVKTKTIGEGYAALSMLDTNAKTSEELIEKAQETIEGVVTGLVSKATRDALMNGKEVHEGHYIGFSAGEVYADAADLNEAAEELADGLSLGDYDIALLIRGKDTTKEQAEALKETLEKKYKWAEIIIIDGLQPVYEYVLVLE